MFLRPIFVLAFAISAASAVAAPLYLGDQEVPEDRLDDVLEHCEALASRNLQERAPDPSFDGADVALNGAQGDDEGSGEGGSEDVEIEPEGGDADDNEGSGFALDQVSLEDCKQAGLVH